MPLKKAMAESSTTVENLAAERLVGTVAGILETVTIRVFLAKGLKFSTIDICAVAWPIQERGRQVIVFCIWSHVLVLLRLCALLYVL